MAKRSTTRNHLDLQPSETAAAGEARMNVALARGLEVLKAFRQGEVFLGNMELARRTGIPKATISRMTFTLAKLGFLSFSSKLQKYSMSPGILALAYPIFIANPIHAYARPLMQRLAEETQSTIGLAVQDGLSMVYLEYAKTRSAETFDTTIGFRVPIQDTTMGWSCLAAMDDDAREATIKELQQITTKKEWPAVRARIEAGMRQVWEQGFCVALAELHPQRNAVGAPFVASNRQIYALNFVAPRVQYPEKRLREEIGPRLLQVLDELRGGEPRRHAAFR